MNNLQTCNLGGIKRLPDGTALVRQQNGSEIKRLVDGREIHPLAPVTWPSIDSFQTLGGQQYVIRQGKVYTWPGQVYSSDLFDPSWITKNYNTDRIDRFRSDSTGKNYPVVRSMYENWENATTVRDVIKPEKNWTSMTLLSPAAPSVPAYVALVNGIIAGTQNFIDNDITYEIINGSRVATFKSVAATVPCPLTKCSIDNTLLFLSKNDTYTFEASFRIKQGTPISLFDFESSYINLGPGLRVLLNSSREPYVQLKWGDDPQWNQSGGPVALQLNTWEKLKFVVKLHDTAGTVQLYLNNALIISGTGQTLPVPDAVVDRLELGITSNIATDCILSVKDVFFS